jgi:transposase-like protein
MANYTIKNLKSEFPTDEVCLEYLFNARFTGKTCPSCHKTAKFYLIVNRKRFDCQWCGFSVYPVSGTIFHKSPTPLTDWFHAMFLFASSKNGVAAKEIERQIGVTYKCAWRMAKQIRMLFEQNNISLSGVIEADETYVGGRKQGKRGRGSENKAVVFGMVTRGGNLKARVVPNVKGKTLQPIINQSVKRNSMVITDELKSYSRVGLNGYSHETIKHAVKEYVRGKIHTNNIEGFWSQLKRSIDGTHHAVSPKYLQHYVDEFVYRYNRRNAFSPLFPSVLREVVRKA